jgi:hypothetical protein
MTTIEVFAERGYFFMTIGELLEKAKIVPSYEEGVKLANSGLVEIVSDNFPHAIVETHKEMVCFAEWCDITVRGQTIKVLVKEKL